MAAVWEKLRLPWYAKGALFGVVLTVLLSLPSLLSPPPPDIPTPPAVYGYASTALNFARPYPPGVASKQSGKPMPRHLTPSFFPPFRS
jgi:hypothetical protein